MIVAEGIRTTILQKASLEGRRPNPLSYLRTCKELVESMYINLNTIVDGHNIFFNFRMMPYFYSGQFQSLNTFVM